MTEPIEDPALGKPGVYLQRKISFVQQIYRPMITKPLDSKTYQGDRYTYACRRRLGFGDRPQDYIHSSEKQHSHFIHGTLDLPRQLSEEELEQFDMRLVQITLTTRKSWNNFERGRVFRWAATSSHVRTEPYYMLLSPTGNPENVDMNTLWAAQQVDETTLQLTPMRQ